MDDLNKISLEWFFKYPGLLITCGVLLILIAIIVYVIGKGKEAKGVAVKTKVGQLKKAIGHYVEIGRIEYIDYSIQWPNVNAVLWRKRVSFEYEHEVRIRLTPEKGLSYTPAVFMTLPVDLNELIETVYVSPMAEPWFKGVIVDLMEKYGVKKDVHHSGLDSKGLI